MPRVFVAHADEDYPFIKPLARDLELAGYDCWFYERDTIAGTSYLVQVYEAIQNADAFLLIASSDSLKSQSVTREIEQAHQRHGLSPITILKSVGADQIEKRQPLWHMVLGTTAYLSTDDDYESNLGDEVVAALKKRKLIPSNGMTVSRGSQVRPHPVKTASRKRITPWVSDGTMIRPNMVKEVLFLNETIKEFIEADQRFLFISGEKGLGKTLLLTYKRSLLTELYESRRDPDQSNVIYIPDDHPYLDLMTELPSLSKQHEEFLAQLRNSKRLWSFAIRAAVISQFPEKLDILKETINTHKSRQFNELQLCEKTSPTEVFRELLSLTVKQLNQLIDGSEFVLERIFRSVRCAVLLFIDKVDQGIRGLGKDAWISVQGGLLEASWDCSSTNPHVKIYGTIRDEAFANYESPIKGNLQNAVLSLKYTETDLRQIIDKLSSVYEGVQEFTEFIQMTTVRNNRTGIVEDCFRYMARHTVGRPRDLVLLCGMLHNHSNAISEDIFRKIVNNTAANEVVRNVFEEMNMFLSSLTFREDRDQFFRLIPYNILTRAELIDIADRFSNSANVLESQNSENIRTKDHPFCDLWTCGLMGIVSDDYMQAGVVVQRFKQPHEPGSGFPGCIPEADFYVLLPSLQANIKMQRGAGGGYEMFSCIEIGHHCRWHECYPALIELQRELFKLPTACRELKGTIFSVLPYIHAHLSEQGDFMACMPRTTRDRFNATCEVLERLGYDKLCRQLHLGGLKTNAEKPKKSARQKQPANAAERY